jgi:hypothetical protein
MPEVSSISVSSYDPESLAPLLTERTNDGWEVVGIVTAGTKIVAYLQRAGEEGAPAAAPAADEATEPDTGAAAGAEPSATEGVTAAAGAGAVIAPDTGSTPPVEEPGGWAQAPEPAAPEPAAAEPAGESAAVPPAPPAEPEPEPAPEPEPEPAPQTTVPAGWYADPSGRFELRYWDGNAWTEHVSRAGQQYTDPPVA